MAVTATADDILERWLRATVGSYPAETARQLLDESDPFRNPIGNAMREVLPVLLDAVLGRVSFDVTSVPLDRLIRIRAMQNFTPGQAVGFLLPLIPLLREAHRSDPETEGRIHRLMLAAFDLHAACREQAHAIQLKEIRRRTYVLDRLGVQRSCKESEA
jgi:hypothetical protein